MYVFVFVCVYREREREAQNSVYQRNILDKSYWSLFISPIRICLKWNKNHNEIKNFLPKHLSPCFSLCMGSPRWTIAVSSLVFSCYKFVSFSVIQVTSIS